jgi:hypothetical protein
MKRLHLILSPAWLSLKIFATQGDVSFKAWLFMSCEVEKKDIYSTSKLRDKVRRSAIPERRNWQVFWLGAKWFTAAERESAKLDSLLQSEICLGGGAHVRRLKSPLGKRKRRWRPPWEQSGIFPSGYKHRSAHTDQQHNNY